MIYYNNGTKRDLLIGNSYHVLNHVFGTQTIETSEQTCQDEKPITFFKPEKSRHLQSSKSRLSAPEMI